MGLVPLSSSFHIEAGETEKCGVQDCTQVLRPEAGLPIQL